MLGERIRAQRKVLGLTQEELAERLGYTSKSTINKIEMGINDIPQRKVVEFAKALNVSPAYLVGWDDDEEQVKNEVKANERSAKKMEKPQSNEAKERIASLIRQLAEVFFTDDSEKPDEELEASAVRACSLWLVSWMQRHKTVINLNVSRKGFRFTHGRCCPKCGETASGSGIKYCPNCGTKMPEVKDEEANEK